MLRLEGLTLGVAGRELLVEVDWHLRPGQRVGLVGRNGAGKTTLIRAILNEVEPEEGKVRITGGVKLGYLAQSGVSGSERSAWDEARSGLAKVAELGERLRRATEEGDPEKMATAEEAFRLAGGYAADEKVGEVLWGLGFRPGEWDRPCSTFSGGWQMRIALAKLLLSEPDLLLLDEPTNHLDLAARSWLARYLAQWKGGILLVSHDRHVLDACATSMVELRGLTLEEYAGGYTRWIAERQLREEQREALMERQQEEIARLRRFVERFRYKATKASQAQSRLKMLEKLEADLISAPPPEPVPRLRLQSTESRVDPVIVLRGVSGGWDRPLFSGLNLELRRGERHVLLGPNGVGKSTLLRILGGSLTPLEGQRALGKGVRVGYFEQDQGKVLPPASTPLEWAAEAAPFAPESRVRAVLGSLGISGNRAFQPIGTLSGGERVRVALASLALQPLDVLLLDEPTNHLDAVSVEELGRALEEFPGAVVVVSHDRRLVERLATHVIRMDAAGMTLRRGLLPEDLEPPPYRRPGAEAGAAAAGASWNERQKKGRELERLRKDLARVEGRIATLEAEITAVDAELAATPDAYASLLVRREKCSRELDAAMADWERLAELVG